MVLNKVLNIIENRINEYISKANKAADSNPELCEELNIKALAFNDLLNNIKKEVKEWKKQIL